MVLLHSPMKLKLRPPLSAPTLAVTALEDGAAAPTHEVGTLVEEIEVIQTPVILGLDDATAVQNSRQQDMRRLAIPRTLDQQDARRER